MPGRAARAISVVCLTDEVLCQGGHDLRRSQAFLAQEREDLAPMDREGVFPKFFPFGRPAERIIHLAGLQPRSGCFVPAQDQELSGDQDVKTSSSIPERHPIGFHRLSR